LVAIASFIAWVRLGTDLGYLGLMLMFLSIGLLIIVLGLLSLTVSVGLLVGGVQLLRRRLGGRIAIVLSAAGAVLADLIFAVVPASFLFGKTVVGLPSQSPHGLVVLPALVMAGATITFALVPATRRWRLAWPVPSPRRA
jgi:hypothetical protein